MPNTGIPAPPVYEAGISPAAMLAVFGVLAGASVVIAVVLGVRRRDPLPVAACIGALVCALNEPIYDILGKLVYAHVPSSYVAYTAFGRHIPWSLVVGYVPWVGLVPYLLSRSMAAGITRNRLYIIAAALSVSVGGAEVLNALWLHGWRYYAAESGRGVIAGGLIQMASMPIICAFMYYAFLERVRGIWRFVLGILIPTVALPITFAGTSWPLYVSNYANVSQGVRWIAAIASTGFCVLAVVAVAQLAERSHARTAPAADEADEVPPPVAEPPRLGVPAHAAH
jgi:hypothetical protein